MEDPLDHLDEFDRLYSLTKINGVSEDGFKLRLFPFSLGDKAHQWEKTLPPGSITSWDQCKQSFLAKFFSNSRTARLRNEISGFTQKNGETLCEAWERFKSYQSQCPHHGFTKESLLSTLYRGVLPKIRMLLDTASNGNFLNKDVNDGWELVENLSQSDGNYNEDYDRTIRISTDLDEKYKKEMKAVNDKLDKLLMSQQRNIHFVSEDDPYQILDGKGEQSEEISYVQNQGGYNKGYNPYKQNPNLSYRSTNVANPQDQQGYQPSAGPLPGFQPQHAPPPQAPDHDMKNMLQQLLQGQTSGSIESAKKFAEMNNKMDCTYNALNLKIEALTSRILHLESKNASTSSGQLPGKAMHNPKEFATAHAITLRELPITKTSMDITADSEDLYGEDFSPNEDSTQQIKVDHDPPAMVKHDIPKSRKPRYIPPPYTPPLPFPERFKEKIMEKYKGLLDTLEGTELTKALVDAHAKIPSYNKILKEVLLGRIQEKKEITKDAEEKAEEDERVKSLNHECCAIVHKEVIPKKLEDPGSFTLPCTIGPLSFSRSLCDLGASVSLMPLSVARRLGFTQYKTCNISLILADRTVRVPYGLLEDLPVKIGEVEVPTDFIVLEMDDEPQDPLILGRPFLATAGAIIDVGKGMIDLNPGKDFKMKFDIKDILSTPTVDGHTFSTEDESTKQILKQGVKESMDPSSDGCLELRMIKVLKDLVKRLIAMVKKMGGQIKKLKRKINGPCPRRQSVSVKMSSRSCDIDLGKRGGMKSLRIEGASTPLYEPP
ncbi:uncharacterized protein LOC111829357 [Capsella rubella]|uniref:uncharacterized protein LOC111829357 n=1 Tax=Capsella rubella TaxID=81985 RepID=UPI000CD4D2D9|nr:uncharacterized protein LOC111829357 [Capsella rubella]